MFGSSANFKSQLSHPNQDGSISNLLNILVVKMVWRIFASLKVVFLKTKGYCNLIWPYTILDVHLSSTVSIWIRITNRCKICLQKQRSLVTSWWAFIFLVKLAQRRLPTKPKYYSAKMVKRIVFNRWHHGT